MVCMVAERRNVLNKGRKGKEDMEMRQTQVRKLKEMRKSGEEELNTLGE